MTATCGYCGMTVAGPAIRHVNGCPYGELDKQRKATMSFEEDMAYATGAAQWLDAKQQQAYQDQADGAALRRLREALAGHHEEYIVIGPHLRAPVSVGVSEIHDGVAHEGTGNTIAEAAGACRKALTKTS